MINQVVLVGRLTADPEVVDCELEKKKTTLVLAVPRSFKNNEGVYETDFIRCILWNNIAQTTSEYCKSGSVIGIKGRIQTSSYVVDGQTKYATDVIAERVTFLSSKEKDKTNQE